MDDLEIVVIGGSLSGLTFALACAKRGLKTLILERTSGSHRDGATLGVDRDLLLRITGENTSHGSQSCSFPVLAGKRQASTWQAIYTWLRGQISRHDAITLKEEESVIEIKQDTSGATAITAEGQRYKAHLIVGADGYRSLVRRIINPEQPSASFAGYLIWRGLVPEAALTHCHFSPQNEGIALVNETGHRLVAYPVANSDGSLATGRRLVNFTWYDAGRLGLLRGLRCVSTEGEVLRSLAAGDIPAAVKEELGGLARRIWPVPWCSAIIYALEHGQIFATPVAEYAPVRLCRGNLAIIGDAAHAASPATGKGFVHGILDADALAESLTGKMERGITAALEVYEGKRLPQARAIVASSAAWSRAFMQNDAVIVKSVINISQ